MFKNLILIVLCAVSFSGIPHDAHAATPEIPPLPEPIAGLKKDGAQLKYLGRDLGFDGWIAIKDGQEQYFYVTPDGSAFFLGVLFNKNGHAVTFDQMKRLQGQKDPALNNLENAPSPVAPVSSPTPFPSVENSPAPRSASLPKSEQFFADVLTGHAFPLSSKPAKKTAPTIYMFADPLCPHCKDMIKMVAPAVDRGDINLQILMIGAMTADSAALASGILSQKKPGAALQSLMNGTLTFKKGDANNPKIIENLGILTKWGFDGTPVTTYRSKDGAVKLLQGPPKSLDIMMQDLR